MIDVVDLTVVVGVWVLLFVTIGLALPDGVEPREDFALLGLMALAFLYMVVLKRSDLRTVGYRLCGARIVNLTGARPGIGSMTIRLLFAVLGPFNLLVDLVWLGGDQHRQALRDKFAHTYVVRADAQPAGRGPIVYVHYGILTWSFIFPEVRVATRADVP